MSGPLLGFLSQGSRGRQIKLHESLLRVERARGGHVHVHGQHLGEHKHLARLFRGGNPYVIAHGQGLGQLHLGHGASLSRALARVQPRLVVSVDLLAVCLQERGACEPLGARACVWRVPHGRALLASLGALRRRPRRLVARLPGCLACCPSARLSACLPVSLAARTPAASPRAVQERKGHATPSPPPPPWAAVHRAAVPLCCAVLCCAVLLCRAAAPCCAALLRSCAPASARRRTRRKQATRRRSSRGAPPTKPRLASRPAAELADGSCYFRVVSSELFRVAS